MKQRCVLAVFVATCTTSWLGSLRAQSLPTAERPSPEAGNGVSAAAITSAVAEAPTRTTTAPNQPAVAPSDVGSAEPGGSGVVANQSIPAVSGGSSRIVEPAPSIASARGSGSNSDEYSGAPTWFRVPPAIGAYGAPTLLYSRIAHKSGALLGVEGALLFDHRFALGLAGYQWTTETHSSPDASGAPRNLEVSYGGMVVKIRTGDELRRVRFAWASHWSWSRETGLRRCAVGFVNGPLQYQYFLRHGA